MKKKRIDGEISKNASISCGCRRCCSKNHSGKELKVELIKQGEEISTLEIKKENSALNERGFDIIRITFSAILLVILYSVPLNYTFRLVIGIIALFVAGYEILLNCVKNIIRKVFLDENTLMLVASVTAFFIGDFCEGILIALLYCVGEMLEDIATDSSKRKIAGLSSLKVVVAHLVTEKGVVDVDPATAPIGSVIEVRKGESVQIDGVLMTKESQFDTKTITGESKLYSAKKGDKIYSGSVNMGDVIMIRTEKLFKDSAVENIISIVENATSKKAKTQKFITSFARIYTPIVVLVAILVAVIPPLVDGMNFIKWIYKALSFLVISCPCALVISVPLAFFVGIGSLAKKGVLVKGSVYIERLSKVKTAVFDKTGTLTKGNFSVDEIQTLDGFDENTLLNYARSLEKLCTHPISKAVISYKNNREFFEVRDFKEFTGKGIVGSIQGKIVAVGNVKLMKNFSICLKEEDYYGTILYVAVDGVLAGKILLCDAIKDESLDAVKKLKEAGVSNTIILSGDRKNVCENIGDKLGIDSVYSGLLPSDKAEVLKRIMTNSKGKTLYVGDGVNDSPCLALSDVGVSMGKMGSDVANQSADAVIMDDNLNKISLAIKKSKRIIGKVKINIYGSLLIKIMIMIFSVCFTIPVWVSLFADVGVMLLAVCNSLTAK